MPTTTTAPKPKQQPRCRHRSLHFSDGGYRICCDDCPQEWTGVDESDLPKFEMIGHGLFATEVRRDPFYISKDKPKS